MASYKDLGRVQDLITSFDKVSSTDNVDTYRLETSSGYTKDVPITNGKDGISGLGFKRLGMASLVDPNTDSSKQAVYHLAQAVARDMLTKGFTSSATLSSDKVPLQYVLITQDANNNVLVYSDFAIDINLANDDYANVASFNLGNGVLYGKITPVTEEYQSYGGSLVDSGALNISVYIYTLEESSLSKATQDFVDRTNNQEISGTKTFKDPIHTNQVANENGSALVSYNETKDTSVFGSVDNPCVLMGKNARPSYSNDSSDLTGSDVALLGDIPSYHYIENIVAIPFTGSDSTSQTFYVKLRQLVSSKVDLSSLKLADGALVDVQASLETGSNIYFVKYNFVKLLNKSYYNLHITIYDIINQITYTNTNTLKSTDLISSFGDDYSYTKII